ncbi:MAG TPA: putrescine aminotransferase [Ruminococcaceae bacterium]|nr:putrescine aminotransferase [Oscillospiraceae bacterium]
MKWLSKTYVSLILLFLYAPIAVLIVFSFNESKSRGAFTGFTLNWYKQLFSNELILNSLLNTAIVAVVSTVIATVIGTAAAIGINSLNRWMRSVVMNLTYLPIINPEIVTGVSLMLLFVFLKLKFGLATLIIAHITFNVPYIILNVLPKLRQMDKFVYEAALDLGCSPLSAFFKVVLPEIMPGILSGFLMAFTYSLDDFVISYFTSGVTSQTLPITIYAMTRRKVSPEINALSTIIFFVVLIVLVLVNLSDIKKEKILRQKRRELA